MYTIVMELPSGRRLTWHPNGVWMDVEHPFMQWTKGEVIRELPGIMALVDTYSNNTKIFITRAFELWIKIEINRD